MGLVRRVVQLCFGCSLVFAGVFPRCRNCLLVLAEWLTTLNLLICSGVTSVTVVTRTNRLFN